MPVLLVLLLGTASLAACGLAWNRFMNRKAEATLLGMWGNNQAVGDEGRDSDAGRAAPRPCREELRGLLDDLEREDPELALPPPDGGVAPSDPALRAEAEAEVNRVLSCPTQFEVLGGGTATQRRMEFRRLALLFHPDKGLVSGERVTLALRRIVEAHRCVSGRG